MCDSDWLLLPWTIPQSIASTSVEQSASTILSG